MSKLDSIALVREFANGWINPFATTSSFLDLFESFPCASYSTHSMTLQELLALTTSGSTPFLVDVRSPGEFAVGHVPGATNIPMDEAEARLPDIPADRPVVLICQSGSRAEMTCELIRHERPNSAALDGGTDAWIAAGLPAVSSRRTRWSIDRQVRLTAGLLVLSGSLLAIAVSPSWVYLPLFIGTGLTLAGLTNFCGMAVLFAIMPWNKPKRPTSTTPGIQAS
jgi:rhodanese-related sulfurtransferase